jgi:hypothetical protein
MGVCDTFNCTNGLPNAVIPNCGDVDYGQAFVKFFIAKDTAASFSDETDLVNSTTWQTKLGYSASGANAVNRIVAIGDVHNGLKPAAEAETEIAPYGGDELITRKHTVTFEIKRWNKDLVDSVNQLRCVSKYKVWALTNKGYLFGGTTGWEDSSISWGGIEFAGIGAGKSKSTNTITFNAIDDSEPVLATFLKTLTN